MARLNSGGYIALTGIGGDRMRRFDSAPDVWRTKPARFRNGPNENSAADKLPRSGC